MLWNYLKYMSYSWQIASWTCRQNEEKQYKLHFNCNSLYSSCIFVFFLLFKLLKKLFFQNKHPKQEICADFTGSALRCVSPITCSASARIFQKTKITKIFDLPLSTTIVRLNMNAMEHLWKIPRLCERIIHEKLHLRFMFAKFKVHSTN